MPRGDSTPQPHQASSRRPTAYTAWPLGSAEVSLPIYITIIQTRVLPKLTVQAIMQKRGDFLSLA